MTGAATASPSVVSNGRTEIRIDAENGAFDVFDVERRELIIDDARVGFSVAPYVELSSLGEKGVETAPQSIDYTSQDCANRTGTTGSLISRKDGVGELEVTFTLRPGRSFLEIGFAFKNLAAKPVRLRRVSVLNGVYMPSLDRKDLLLLNGDSGGAMTVVRKTDTLQAENNLLCFFADPQRPRSLVAGGLTYEDYRKSAAAAGASLDLFAWDPVGKRVDPDSVYSSPDRFYVDGLGTNPFEALEAYAKATRHARGINVNYYTFPSTCMWFLSVTHFGGDAGSTNSSAGAVAEMRRIRDSGFLKYSPVAVRLVPDCYEQNNQQGWWDDEHWRMHGRNERCVVESHYCAPYETTAKWAGKVTELGGIPLTYFQPGIRSEDYAKAYPGHMLYNQSQKLVWRDGKVVGDPHPLIGTRGTADRPKSGRTIPGYGKLFAESYDYTDRGFLAHWRDVNRDLSRGGVQGVFYDYPDRAFAVRGGFEDRYATATHAYRNVYRIARQELGPEAYLQERLGPGSDATLDVVSSVRTAGDNNALKHNLVASAAMRWYKNRRLTNYDMDGKALLATGDSRSRTLTPIERRAVLTMSYAVSGRLLLTESFRLFPEPVLHDLSRVFPFHATPLSARPLDAFTAPMSSGRELGNGEIPKRDPLRPRPICPRVYDFAISGDWHQLVLYGAGDTSFRVPLSGDTAFGGLGLDPGRDYHVYDFWNDAYVGKFRGDSSLVQVLEPGEARMLAIHAAEENPQWISTDRHVMQGYVDLKEKPAWDASLHALSGVSSVVGGEPYCVTLALNGRQAQTCQVQGATGKLKERDEPGLVDLVIQAARTADTRWSVFFR